MARILFLDDDADTVRLLGEFLESVGHHCVGTTDSHEALGLLRREPVDLFIQDCLRPGINGFDFYHILKADEMWCFMPVLFFSAGIGPEETAEMRAPYGDDHLQKPASIEELLRAISNLLKRFGKLE